MFPLFLFKESAYRKCQSVAEDIKAFGTRIEKPLVCFLLILEIFSVTCIYLKIFPGNYFSRDLLMTCH